MDKTTAIRIGIAAGALAVSVIGAHAGLLDASPNAAHAGLIKALCDCGGHGWGD